MAEDYDPHTSTSLALTEVRTVLSRARVARNRVGDVGIERTARIGRGYNGHLSHDGPDVEMMQTALDQVIELLTPWERRK